MAVYPFHATHSFSLYLGILLSLSLYVFFLFLTLELCIFPYFRRPSSSSSPHAIITITSSLKTINSGCHFHLPFSSSSSSLAAASSLPSQAELSWFRAEFAAMVVVVAAMVVLLLPHWFMPPQRTPKLPAKSLSSPSSSKRFFPPPLLSVVAIFGGDTPATIPTHFSPSVDLKWKLFTCINSSLNQFLVRVWSEPLNWLILA